MSPMIFCSRSEISDYDPLAAALASLQAMFEGVGCTSMVLGFCIMMFIP